MSAIIFVEQTIPENHLIKSLRFRAYLSPQEKESILKELRVSIPDLDKYIISMHVDIDLKLYDTKNT